MATNMNKSAVKITTKKHPYGNKANLTEKIVLNAATKAIRKASSRAMLTTGFVVKAENGWVVRMDADGTVHQIKKIKTIKSKIVTD